MKILFVYPNANGYNRIPLGMSVVMTILGKRGHEIGIFDATFVLKGEHADNIIREKAKLVLPTDTSHLYEGRSPEEVDRMFEKKVRSFLPDLVAVGIVEDNYQYADHLLGLAKGIDKNIPVVAGGSTPSVVPEILIENPNIDYIIQGEGEEAMAEFCDLMERDKDVRTVRNLWYKENGGIRHNPIRPFVDMDTIPSQDLDIWDSRHFVKAYNGRLYKAGFFEMSRGCLNKCSYCINESYQRIFHDAGNYHRQKSVGKTIEEIKFLKARHGFNIIFFCDDNFLLMPNKKMEEFTVWKTEVGLPYWINTTVEMVTREKLAMLKDTGCCGIGIGIESGSEWLRRHVLRRSTTNRKIEEAFALIHEFDIRTTANNMIGFPGEHEGDIFETIKLNRRIKPKSCDVTFVAPYAGTAIHAMAKKLNYIEVWDKPGFRGMLKRIHMRYGPVMRTPDITDKRLMDIFYKFADYVYGRLAIPEKFRDSVPDDSGATRQFVDKITGEYRG